MLRVTKKVFKLQDKSRCVGIFAYCHKPSVREAAMAAIKEVATQFFEACEAGKGWEAVQQSANAGRVPFAAKCRWYLSRVQLVRDGTKRNEVLPLQCSNCRSQSLSSRICGLLACQSVVDPGALAVRNQVQARQYPHHGGVAPGTATGGWYSSYRRSRRHASGDRLPASPQEVVKKRAAKGHGVGGLIIGAAIKFPPSSRMSMASLGMRNDVVLGTILASASL
jgi:hypothetical protein